MNKRKTYIAPAIQVVSLRAAATILAGSGNVIPCGGSGGIDIDIHPGEGGDGEDAGDAF